MNILEFLQNIDDSIVLYVTENLRFGALNVVMMVITTLGNAGAVWILCGVLLLINKKTRRRGFAMLICLALCAITVNLLLKNIIARARPGEVLPLTILIRPPDIYSFPSGHAASSFASAYALRKGFGKQAARPSYILASLIAVSRVYVGVHYLSDIAAGAIIGTICAFVVCKAFGKHLD